MLRLAPSFEIVPFRAGSSRWQKPAESAAFLFVQDTCAQVCDGGALHKSVNKNLGSQTHHQINNLPVGTLINNADYKAWRTVDGSIQMSSASVNNVLGKIDMASPVYEVGSSAQEGNRC